MEKDLEKIKDLLLNLDYDEVVELLCSVEEELDKRIVEIDDEGEKDQY